MMPKRFTGPQLMPRPQSTDGQSFAAAHEPRSNLHVAMRQHAGIFVGRSFNDLALRIEIS